MNHFLHGGDLGDIIYSLPTVKALGGGSMWLLDNDLAREPMTFERRQVIAPLLKAQPYIKEVYGAGDTAEFGEGDRMVDLNRFRSLGYNLLNTSLIKMYADAENIRVNQKVPWLKAEPSVWYPSVLISRSARYHGENLDWRKVVERWPHAVFVGTPEEWAAFAQEFNAVHMTYYETPNLNELASVIAGCDLFIGNQSAPLAIAIGLGKPVLMEKFGNNCVFGRDNQYLKLEDVPSAIPVGSPKA